MMRIATGILAILAFSLIFSEAGAESVLERIARTGTITIGHRRGELPFSYIANGDVTGYSIEICLKVIEGMRPALDTPALNVVFVPVTTATRFIMLGAGKIDIECAATTNTVERRKLATFSYPHFVTATRFVSRSKDRLDRLEDLAGRSVVSTTGTINVEQLNTLNRERRLNISVLLSRVHREAFDMVVNGQASAFVMDDILLAGLVASSADPAAFSISSQALSKPEPYGILLPPGDDAFSTLFNAEMLKLFENGEIERLYERWFTRAVPPNGENLKLPLSPELKAVFASPQTYIQ